MSRLTTSLRAVIPDLVPGRRWLGLVFPAALWFVATFFLFGDLGKFTDDWYYVQREPETGAIQSLVSERPLHFWRPLYRVIVPALETVFWRADWVNHLTSAVMHGAVGVLWRLMRELRVPRPAAAVAALWFIVWPSHFEPVFWTAAIPTVLSAGVMAGVWIVQVRLARGDAGAWAYAAIPAMVAVAACLNEQATCGVAALPVLAWCASGRIGRRAVLPALCAAVCIAAYVVAHRAMHFKSPVLGRDSYEPAWSSMPAIAARAGDWMRVQYTSASFLGRALSAGVEALREHPLRAGVMMAALALELVPWARSLAREGESADRRVQVGLIGAGLVAAGAMLAPIVLLNYWLMPRVMYAPQMGMALVIGGLGPLVCGRLPGRVWLTALCGVLLAPCAVMMVGFQRGFQEAGRRTDSEIAQLVALVPDPAPGSVFVPLWVRAREVEGNAARYDLFFWSGFNAWWSAKWVVRLGYQRSDLDSGNATWHECGVLRLRPDSVNVRGVGNVAVDRIVPFVIEADGRVRLVTEIRRGVLHVRVPQAQGTGGQLVIVR